MKIKPSRIYEDTLVGEFTEKEKEDGIDVRFFELEFLRKHGSWPSQFRVFLFKVFCR